MGILLRDVALTYLPGTPMSREVLSCIDLELEAGEILCLVGRTGAGKSTLVHIMGGLLPATCGEMALDGKSLDGRGGMRALRSAVGVLMQSPERQLFAETVEKDVAFGPRNRGVRGEDLAAAVRGALASAGLDPEEYAFRPPFSLSGGEMRRAALAGVLAMRPRYLLMDEPSSGLDLPGRRLLYGILEKQREQGVGILLVTHDWDEVELLADRRRSRRHPLQGEKGACLRRQRAQAWLSLAMRASSQLRPPPPSPPASLPPAAPHSSTRPGAGMKPQPQ